MIRAIMTSNGRCGRILLAPSRSMSTQGNLYLLCVVALFSLIIGTAFSLAGAWLVLPFVGLELLLLAVALYLLLRRLHCRQLLVLGSHKVVICRWRDRVAINRDQVHLQLETPSRYTDWPKMVLTGAGRSIPLGAFLNEKETLCLRHLLSDAGLRSVWQDTQQLEF